MVALNSKPAQKPALVDGERFPERGIRTSFPSQQNLQAALDVVFRGFLPRRQLLPYCMAEVLGVERVPFGEFADLLNHLLADLPARRLKLLLDEWEPVFDLDRPDREVGRHAVPVDILTIEN